MIRKIHLIAACGTGMGALACALKEMGYLVSGSDRNVYPPMSDFLRDRGIELFEGFDPSHLNHSPDLVIVGNAVTRENSEARAATALGIPCVSMPQAVNRFIARGKKVILVTGTHGKTTTSSIMAHLLHSAGMDPSFMIGGILKDFDAGFRIGQGDYMVMEGDEYDTAFFDKGPKFMHYDPEILIMTGIEFDHADIFRDIDHIKEVFDALVRKNAGTSHIIAFDGSPHLTDVLKRTGVRVETYGTKADWSFSDHVREKGKTRFRAHGPGSSMIIETGLAGEHNLFNALACIAAARRIGIPEGDVRTALSRFSGIKRRQEIRGVRNGITIMDDFAHHPTAVRETIHAVRPFYPGGRVVAVFEPRTNTSMRRVFQNTYPDAFTEADMVCVCEPGVKKNIPDQERLSVPQLVADIKTKGIPALYFERTDKLIEFLASELKAGDLVLIMSNGGFDNIHARLLEKI